MRHSQTLHTLVRIHKEAVSTRRKMGKKQRLVDAVAYFPLLAALFAPLSTILDIPGLTEPWFQVAVGSDLKNIKDPAGCLTLSSLSLSFNIIANVLIFLRFTASRSRWKMFMGLSVVSWTMKVIIALVNVSVFGRHRANAPPEAQYSQGFWAAVLSLILAGLIDIALITHWITQMRAPVEEDEAFRVAGARYQGAVTAFLALIALQALIFSRIEKWTYATGLYFSVVTSLTIGFGDYSPTRTSTKILNFPFAILSISLLAVMISQLVGFLSTRASQRKALYKQLFEDEYQKKRDAEPDDRKFSLVLEIAELENMIAQEATLNQVFDLIASTFILLVYWLVGAAVFHVTEDWAYGTSLYFCYVFFLTLGYGDLSPTSPAGIMFFCVYSLIAVPIVTSVVVQIFISTLNRFADNVAERAKSRRTPEEGERQYLHSHAYNVSAMLEKIDKNRAETEEDKQASLARLVLHLAIHLDHQTRALLLQTLEKGSKAQLLLRADQQLHRRVRTDLEKRIKKDHPSSSEQQAYNLIHRFEEGQKKLGKHLNAYHSNWFPMSEELYAEEDHLQQVGRVRLTFAALIAAGSRMLDLQGDEKSWFERRLQHHESLDRGGIQLGDGHAGPAEVSEGVDV